MNEKLSLTELQQVIRDSLYAALPGFYWVFAEISEAKENYAGHCYLELIEKHPDEINIRARVRAVIWNTRYRFLKSFFESTTGETLRPGIKILVRVKIEYHEVYGLSLVINDIDPAFTLGDMAIKRQQILRRLEEEGVITMNKELELTIAPQRIAVVSSKTAAGYQDFVRHLKENIYGYGFSITLFEAVMQGAETEQSVISALDRISEQYEKFDVAVIIRGGGAQSDLSWFDNYNIAYHITQFPLPVITGIGHEKDISVTDIVAYHALKTPTAVADYLIEKMVSAENLLMQLADEISEAVNEIIDSKKERLTSFMTRIIPVSNRLITSVRKDLSVKLVDLVTNVRNRLGREEIFLADVKKKIESASRNYTSSRERDLSRAGELIRINTINLLKSIEVRIKSMSESLNILSPDNVLKRGYTITVLNGQIVSSADKIKPEDEIDTYFHDGKIKSRVLKKSKEKL
ncbi:MAG TPA: exodeoxyribonuclease VII large subunit [Bacteroidales bacterium]|nr:exodeoxyribonuclease VII large subunit [Bacteroidales bacterium]